MDIGILLWNTCNAKCTHCAVNSGPEEKPFMSDEDIFSIVDAAFYDCSAPSIGLSGGEAFVYFDRLCNIVKYATDKGARVAVNTNSYWAKNREVAIEKLSRLKSLGLSKVVVSTDDFHKTYIEQDRVINAVHACLEIHLEVEIQFVATKTSSRLYDFLSKYGDELVNISVREIPLHPVGRASLHFDQEVLFLKDRIPKGLCPSAIPSISEKGHVIPCCNTAGHLESLKMGDISECLPTIFERFKSDPLMYVLRTKGPSALLETAKNNGYKNNYSGYLDQCHLCHELFKDKEISRALRSKSKEIFETDLYEDYMTQYIDNLDNIAACG